MRDTAKGGKMNDIDDENGEMGSQTLYTPLFSGPAALDTGGLLDLLNDPEFTDKVDKAESEDRQLTKTRQEQQAAKKARDLQDRLDGTAADPFNGKALNLGQLIQQALEDGILQPSMPYNKLFQAAA